MARFLTSSGLYVGRVEPSKKTVVATQESEKAPAAKPKATKAQPKKGK